MERRAVGPRALRGLERPTATALRRPKLGLLPFRPAEILLATEVQEFGDDALAGAVEEDELPAEGGCFVRWCWAGTSRSIAEGADLMRVAPA